MQHEDKLAFATEMTGVSEIYGKDLSRALMQIYFDTLSEFDIGTVRAAIHAHVKDPERGQFFPKPADLIDKINGTTHEAALSAWPEVLRLAADSRRAESINVLTEQVVRDMGGWRRFGMADSKELGWLQKEFVERYEAQYRALTNGSSALADQTAQRRRLNKPGTVVHINALLGKQDEPA